MPPRRNRKKHSNRGKKERPKQEIRRILVICEDEKSSRDYLASFPVDDTRVEIACVGTGMNTDSLMEEAIKRKNEDGFDEAWVVFDKDDFSSQQFNRAFDLARNQPNVEPCWSNECFELWYLLHFQFQNTGIGREDIYGKLNSLLGKGYDKSDTSIYEDLKDKMDKGLSNAARLAHLQAQSGDERSNPSTSVHELVALLLSFDPDNQ